MNPSVFGRLRRKLSFWYAGVFAVILVAFGAAMYAYLAVGLTQGVDNLNRMALEGVLESVSIQKGRLSVDTEDFAHEAEEMRAAYNVSSVRVFDAAGRSVAEAGRPPLGVSPNGPACETLRSGDEEVRVLRHPLALGQRALGTVVLGRPLKERNEALENLAHALLFAIPLAVGVTLLAGAFLAGKALRPIKDAFERQRQFIADASHELRTPLAIIQSQAEVGQGGEPADALRALGTVERTARRMGALVADLLLLTRVDASALTLERKRFYLDELAEEVTADLAPLARERGLKLRCEAQEADVAVLADPERIRQVLTILLDNALAYTPAPGEVRVHVWRDPTRPLAVLCVADSGLGIAPEALPHLFDRFYRADPARSGHQHGTGLGLAIAKAIAQAHGGELDVVSEVGQGSEFCLALPCAEA